VVVKRLAHDDRYVRAVDALRAARIDLALSQEALASKLGKRQQFVSKYESGERRLDLVEFLDVATALDLDVQTLISALNRSA